MHASFELRKSGRDSRLVPVGPLWSLEAACLWTHRSSLATLSPQCSMLLSSPQPRLYHSPGLRLYPRRCWVSKRPQVQLSLVKMHWIFFDGSQTFWTQDLPNLCTRSSSITHLIIQCSFIKLQKKVGKNMDWNNHSTNVYHSIRYDFTARGEKRLTEWKTLSFLSCGSNGETKVSNYYVNKESTQQLCRLFFLHKSHFIA
jgi:hypothetical protein